MNFRLVWLGSDDDRDGAASARDAAAFVPQTAASGSYRCRGTEMVRQQQLGNGRTKITVIANFTARIVRDLVLDDDAEPGREFEVEAEWEGQRLCFRVSAAEFGRMSWVLNQLGPQAIVYPGQQQHARAAIQYLSGAIRQERIFTHLGWRRQGPDWIYLQTGGAVGAQGVRQDVQVQLPMALEHYQLRSSADSEECRGAIRASLELLDVAPDRVSCPLLAAVYRAPLGKVDFSLFLAGRSGVFKTALAALCQQHFGAQMDAKALPAHFASTANALEELAFAVKDALLVVDDFVPAGGPGDGALEATAERLFRATGNHQGRSRMRGNGQLCVPRPPRALVLATGEEVPRGQSLRARLLIVELRPAEVDRLRLSRCQSAAGSGQLSTAMAAFLSWMAERYADLQRRLEARVHELRSRSLPCASHARLPSALGELFGGWEIWLQFALETGAISSGEQVELRQRMSTALDELAAQQAPYQTANDPALRFVALLRAALAGGRAYVANPRGGTPETPPVWGWRRGSGGHTWLPCGGRIGWVAGGDLYLDSCTSYQVAQQAAGADRLAVSEQTLRRRLHGHGLLVTTDAGRQTLLVRKTLEGTHRQVLHLKVGNMVEAIPETSADRVP